MLNVISLRRAANAKLTTENNLRSDNLPRRHIISLLSQEKSGRLNCVDEPDVEIPTLEIYAAR